MEQTEDLSSDVTQKLSKCYNLAQVFGKTINKLSIVTMEHRLKGESILLHRDIQDIGEMIQEAKEDLLQRRREVKRLTNFVQENPLELSAMESSKRVLGKTNRLLKEVKDMSVAIVDSCKCIKHIREEIDEEELNTYLCDHFQEISRISLLLLKSKSTIAESVKMKILNFTLPKRLQTTQANETCANRFNIDLIQQTDSLLTQITDLNEKLSQDMAVYQEMIDKCDKAILEKVQLKENMLECLDDIVKSTNMLDERSNCMIGKIVKKDPKFANVLPFSGLNETKDNQISQALSITYEKNAFDEDSCYIHDSTSTHEAAPMLDNLVNKLETTRFDFDAEDNTKENHVIKKEINLSKSNTINRVRRSRTFEKRISERNSLR